MRVNKIFLWAFSVLCFPMLSYASYTVKDGKFVDTQKVAGLTAQEHYALAKEALEEKNWPELLRQTEILQGNFSETIYASDAFFYMGVALFHLGEYGLSNDYFSAYIKKYSAPKFFEEVFHYKYKIAQKFQGGEKKRLFGLEHMPKWFSSEEDAIVLYDEVITALPQHDLAVQSLFGKGSMLANQKNFKESIEVFQTLLRRFPRHPLALDSYVAITRVYRTQGDQEFPNPDFLDLAEINLSKFKMDFPGDPKIAEAESFLGEMTELYAVDLYDIAQFYERTKKISAAMIYYAKIISKYPHTKTGKISEKRLAVLQEKMENEQKIAIPKSDQRVIVDVQEEVTSEKR